MKKNTDLTLVKQTDIINEIHDKYLTIYTKKDVKNFMTALEDVCKDFLMNEPSEKHPIVQVKIFPGLSLFGKLESEKQKNAFGVVLNIPRHINIRAQIANGFARRLNEDKFGWYVTGKFKHLKIYGGGLLRVSEKLQIFMIL